MDTTGDGFEPSGTPQDSDMDDESLVLKKAELIDQVVLRTGLKKRDVKPVIEAALVAIKDAVVEDHQLSLAPLGKLKVLKTKELPKGAKALTLRLRVPGNETLEPDETVVG